MYNKKYKNEVNGVGIKIVETGDIFETRTQCAEYLGVNPGMITMCLNGTIKSCRGYHLEIVETVFKHELTKDILDELYEMTGVDCEWREHPFRPDLYVSDIGLIAKNVRGKIILKRPHLQNSGYLVVSVDDYRNLTSLNHNQLLHRLVAETYIPNQEEKRYVNHIDGNKFNCSADNLEWCTAIENMCHAYRNGLRIGEKVMIEETGEVFNTSSDCARAIGGTMSGIHDCKSGRQRKHRGYHFRFLEENQDDFDYSDRPRFLGVIVTDKWSGEEAFFDTIEEVSYELHIPRESIVDALLGEDNEIKHYIFEFAEREEAMLYADEDNKFLSWVRIGIF